MCLAVPGQIDVLLDEGPLDRRGIVDFDGVLKEVSLAFVPEAMVGDYVVVHVGVAISMIDPDEAGGADPAVSPERREPLCGAAENQCDVARQAQAAAAVGLMGSGWAPMVYGVSVWLEPVWKAAGNRPYDLKEGSILNV